MENFKFYNVEIGTCTRSGDLTVHNSFVCKSTKNQNELFHFYYVQYSGFGIRVTEITTVIEPKIITEKQEDDEKFALKEEIKMLKNAAGKTLTGYLYKDNLNPSNKAIYNSLIIKEKELEEEKNRMINGLIDQLETKYNPFYNRVIIEQNISSGVDCKYRIELKDKLS